MSHSDHSIPGPVDRRVQPENMTEIAPNYKNYTNIYQEINADNKKFN